MPLSCKDEIYIYLLEYETSNNIYRCFPIQNLSSPQQFEIV